MNKTLLWVVGAIVVIGAVVLVVSGKNKSGSQPQDNNSVAGSTQANTQANAAAQASPQKSLAELVASGGAQKCTYSEASGTGSFYVSGGKARGDFSSTTGGQSVKGHMILDNKTSYVWMDGQSQGFKMTADASAQANAGANAQSQGVDAQKKMNYSCSSWTADSTMFALPSGVQFTDMSSLQIKK